MKHTIRVLPLCRLLPAVLAVVMLAGTAAAQIRGTIKTTDGKTVSGQIRWLNSQKKYIVMSTRPGTQATIEVQLTADQVADIQVPQPRELGPAIQAVRSGSNIAGAIPVLEKIIIDYTMMQWDEPAARVLAEAQLAVGKPDAAIKACERVIAIRPEAAYKGDMAVVYWQALLKANRSAKLEALLKDAIAKGGREASASALIMRGDMLMESKQPRDALKDGYLRVVILYENVRSVQPEALYKAAKAFEAIHQNPNAEKMRSILRTKYASSEYARKI
ncbi:MAG: hypothetical protein GX174_00870 [Lentisphaerae bacterium]|jgi:hypothetical protein|nr:hypothetical protein [Lentisphaerota bacterium]